MSIYLKGRNSLSDFLGVGRAAISIYVKQGCPHIRYANSDYFNLLKVIDWLRGQGKERRQIADKAETNLEKIKDLDI